MGKDESALSWAATNFSDCGCVTCGHTNVYHLQGKNNLIWLLYVCRLKIGHVFKLNLVELLIQEIIYTMIEVTLP